MVMMTASDIRELRKTLGITAAEFAAKLGVTESAVCYWERDERHPAWKHLVKLNELREQVAKKGRKLATA